MDFELLWGVFDVVDYKSKKEYFRQTRDIIPQILYEFQASKVHATWATVGMLFNKDWEEWEENLPEVLPNYKKQELSAYDYAKSIKSSSTEEFCFAPNLIKQIAHSKGQELASHTYSHYYCLEEGQTAKSFDKDIEKAVAVAAKIDVELKSLVFPRNQFAPEYLEICNKHGIKNVRTNPDSWYWKDAASNSVLNKLGRTGDAYMNLGKKSYRADTIDGNRNQSLEQKASRFLRPAEGSKILRKLKINRILFEMEQAAKNNEVYHLWWHPHNFGDQPEKNMNDLRIILDHFSRLRTTYNFQSKNMAELGDLLR
ncbi:polysaccharide deacetylase family protein [Salinimicrobium sp. TH3]|nr:polysaccharide deacetylase family protein [Salinimicrobium sp. TH3]